MQYSPKLKKAAEEIKRVLDKYDIAGLVILHTPGNGEFVLKLHPSYSALKFDKESGRLRLRAKAEDFKDGAAGRDKKLTETANMLQVLYDMGSEQTNILYEMTSLVNKVLGAEHDKGSSTSNEEQNN